MMPTPPPTTSWKPTDLERLLSACSVVNRPAPTIMSTQPTNVVMTYFPVFLTTTPATIATRLMLYDNPKRSTPAPVGDLSLHASKKTAYQSTSGHTRRQLVRMSEACGFYVQLKVASTTAITKFWR